MRVCVCVTVATSTGEHDGMANVYKGACYYSNMKLQIHVCCGDKTGTVQ